MKQQNFEIYNLIKEMVTDLNNKYFKYVLQLISQGRYKKPLTSYEKSLLTEHNALFETADIAIEHQAPKGLRGFALHRTTPGADELFDEQARQREAKPLTRIVESFAGSENASSKAWEQHHIIPRFANGLDVDANLLFVTREEHIQLHKLRYETYGQEQDLAAMNLLEGKQDKAMRVMSKKLNQQH